VGERKYAINGRQTAMSTIQRRKSTGTKKRIIAVLTAIMLVASIVSFTALATNEDTGYIPVEVADEYVSSDLETNTELMLDDEQASKSEASDLDLSEADRSALNNSDTDSSDSNSYTQDNSSYIGNKSEPEDEYDYDYYCELDDYNECVCACDYDYGDDCNCECIICECCDIEIEALTELIVTDWGGLLDVFENLMTTVGPYIVSVAGSITMEAQLNIPAGRKVNLGGGGVLYQPTANARHFGVEGTLILNGITLRGTGVAAYRGGIMVNGGELIMNTESVIEGNRALFGGGISVNDGTLTMFKGRISNNVATIGGGAVWIDVGNMTMNDGLIIDNIARDFGGGVGSLEVFDDITLIMNGGTISGNKAMMGGGVNLGDAIFTVGETDDIVFGYISFTMNGGTISRNEATTGGGVSLMSGNLSGNFTMNGGTINGNEATGSTWSSGGGLYLFDSIFVMNGGTIGGNKAQFGGGVDLGGRSEFTMNNGMINNNFAAINGGGIYASFSDIVMNDGVIKNNTVGLNGGGVFVDGTSTFSLDGGTINNNVAHENGGGLFIWRHGGPLRPTMLTMTGGAITNNTAKTGNGGGIFSAQYEDYQNPLTPTAYSNIIFEDGIISGNTAGNGRYALPVNYYERPFGRLLNNYDINFRGSNRVEVITFDLNNGNVGGDSSNIEVIVDNGANVCISNIPIVERFGYNFLGWFFGDELLTRYEIAEIVVDASMTFEAQWESILQIIPEPEYRSIRIYYYILKDNVLQRDIENNPYGRQYFGEVGTSFNLGAIDVLDRNKLAGYNDYLFTGWLVRVGGMPHTYYLYEYGKDVLELHGSFEVPAPTSALELSAKQLLARISETDLNVVGDDISLNAVWMVYEPCEDGNGENGNDDGKNDNDTITPPAGGDNQRRLPQTGIESNMLLCSGILALVILMGISAGLKIRNDKNIRKSKTNE